MATIGATTSRPPAPPAAKVSQPQGSAAPPSAPPSEGPRLSGLADTLKQLEQLQASDPSRFGRVMNDVATKLSAAAETASGPDAQQLGALAARFRQAGETGDLSLVRPQGPPPGERPPAPVEKYRQAGQTPSMTPEALAGVVQQSLREATQA